MWVDARRGVLAWLIDSPLDMPPPPGLEWMTPDELDGYYLLFDDTASTPAAGSS
jgi:hypothetical protein